MKQVLVILTFGALCGAISGTSRAAETPDVPEWSLADLERLALTDNPDLKSARAGYEAVSKTVTEALSAYLPQISAQARFDQTTLPAPSALSNTLIGTSEPYASVVVGVRQMIFDFGKNLSLIQAARGDAASAEQEAEATKAVVLLAVDRACFGVQAADGLLSVAKKSLERYEETLRRTEVLVRTGARPPFDLTQAKVEVANARLTVINAQGALQIARITLLNVIGKEKQIDFKLKPESAATAAPDSRDLKLDQLTSIALESRPEVKSNSAQVEAARSRFSSAFRDYLPSIGFEGWYGKYLPDYPVPLRDSWGVGAVLSWRLFDGLKTTARVGELGARREQQEALLDRQRERIVSEVASAYTGLAQSESNVQLATDRLTAAQENVRLAQKRYEASVATILELLVAQNALVSAEAFNIDARAQHEIAVASLRTAVGGTLPAKGTP